MNQQGNFVNPSQMQQATPSVLRIPLRMKKKKRKDWQLTESENSNNTVNSKDPELFSRFRDIQHFAGGVHLPSTINFQTGGFKKSFRAELNALKSQFKILKVGLQLTEHPNFKQQDLATIRKNFQNIFLYQFHYLNNRKKELYILQSTNGEVAQVFKSLGHEGHLEGADQLRLAQAIAFYNESQKLEKSFGRGQQQFRGNGRGFNNRPFNNQFNSSRGQYSSLANRMSRRGHSNQQNGSSAIQEGTNSE